MDEVHFHRDFVDSHDILPNYADLWLQQPRDGRDEGWLSKLEELDVLDELPVEYE